jgi:WD40 repeat protein
VSNKALEIVWHCLLGLVIPNLDHDVSLNTGYLLTGGEDNMVKIWDYEAQKTVPYYFQSFIGHTYPITSIIFNPKNQG